MALALALARVDADPTAANAARKCRVKDETATLARAEADPGSLAFVYAIGTCILLYTWVYTRGVSKLG